MILLDTNVVSEPLRLSPHPGVVTWLDAQHPATLYLSAISVAEIRYGIASLPVGKRRTTLADRFERDVLPVFDVRILSFDEPAADHYAAMRAEMRSRGRAIGDLDAMIAAIALSRRLTISTRDTTPFLDAGLKVINPFNGAELTSRQSHPS
ncbi:MAG: type II toxin-antitoxin system VapC family toxin [Propioniciclava sp.]|uniref:type II toxin-antitoxin system VapC family toxin n=1 Tax=Propioniciclava sp. TaxID=2038686 RepID=UPI0039E40C1D